MWVAFAVQKLLTFFQQKNIRILCIESARTVNEMTLNELVKLTTLWTTGPCNTVTLSIGTYIPEQTVCQDQTPKNSASDKGLFWTHPALFFLVGLGGSVGCAVWQETRRSRVQPPPRSATFFRGDWSWNIFYGHSLPSADSRRAVVSFWWKNVQILVNRLED